jgi:hypothetical protein
MTPHSRGATWHHVGTGRCDLGSGHFRQRPTGRKYSSPAYPNAAAYLLAMRLIARVNDFAFLLGTGMAAPVDATR